MISRDKLALGFRYLRRSKTGEIVGYHCRNGEIERLEKLLDEALG
jgi:hypothetical protein